MNGRMALQDLGIEADMLGLANVIELFAQACRDLLADLAGVDRRIGPLVQREDDIELLEIGLDG